MADVIQVQYDTSAINLYAVIRDTTGQAYRADTQVFEAYSTANLTSTKYAIALTEQGTASRYYTVAFPTAIPPGLYSVMIFKRAGANPAETDPIATGGPIDWTGVTFPTDGGLISDAGTAQAGAATAITLRSGASATDDYYTKAVIGIVRGTGQGQARQITGYVGSTKVATVDTAWSTIPDNTSVYQILGRVV